MKVGELKAALSALNNNLEVLVYDCNQGPWTIGSATYDEMNDYFVVEVDEEYGTDEDGDDFEDDSDE